MYLPSPWHATSDCDTSMAKGSCKFDLRLQTTNVLQLQMENGEAVQDMQD